MQLEAENLRRHETGEGSDTSRSVRVVGRSPKLPAFCDVTDDKDSYIHRFERWEKVRKVVVMIPSSVHSYRDQPLMYIHDYLYPRSAIMAS